VSAAPERAWEVRRWQPGDEVAMMELFRVEFGRERTPAHWKWKFLENPCGGPFVSLAWHRDPPLLVGNQVLMPFPLCVRGRRLLAGHSLDLVVHHDFRRQGIHEVTGRDAEAFLREHGGEALVAFPNAASYPGFVRSQGWKRILEPTMWKRRLGLRGKLERRLRVPVLAAAADAVFRARATGALRRQLAAAQAARPDLRVEHVGRLPDGVDALWERERTRVHVSLWKDREYLAWRYERHPEQRFEYHALVRGSELAGLAVTGIRDRMALLCELLEPDRDEAAGRLLVLSVCARVAGNGADEVHFLGHDDGWFGRVLEGFTAAPATENVFVGRAIADEALTAELADAANWTLTYGDGDFI
jgi:hypothetical protein